jgi:hypothetical protein
VTGAGKGHLVYGRYSPQTFWRLYATWTIFSKPIFRSPGKVGGTRFPGAAPATLPGDTAGEQLEAGPARAARTARRGLGIRQAACYLRHFWCFNSVTPQAGVPQDGTL